MPCPYGYVARPGAVCPYGYSRAAVVASPAVSVAARCPYGYVARVGAKCPYGYGRRCL